MIFFCIGLFAVIGGLYYFFYSKEKKEVAAITPAAATVAPQQLQLQAYERLVILAERVALPNLISRCNQPGLDKSGMQLLLTQTIKQEFEHNLSQQIYVTADAWNAVRTFKDQNIHVINQVAAILPATATGADLNKNILDVLMQQPQGSMHGLVQEAISYEAKKVMR
ncbi:MAG: hypothetical protein RLZZ316_1906 [Bacteroidota bacterium]